MIERLMDLECPCGEPEYSRLAEEITQMKRQLSGQLGRQGVQYLEQLTDLRMRQETSVLRDAFADGFWSAVELMMEYHHRRK